MPVCIGDNVWIGSGAQILPGVTIVDGGWITIGSFCLIAPNVVFSTSGHPILPQLRKNHYVYNLPVCIGDNVWIGSGAQILPGVTFVDDGWITIGSFCLIAPNVVFSTSGHPILPQLRKNHYVYNLPVCIGDNVWIGSGAQILPGVTIGENRLIGAGSVVTHDIPANVAAYGVPCKVIREIGEQDRRYYDKDRRLDVWE
ncbi:hypothetical protein IAG03_02305 [Clostridiales bacterium NSJ-40]|uniref:Acetyltransferase n=1 Tax=Yeguia hominis TaxID=2763662 RepID=A0A926D7M7_9FIRM|nr:hypothetical protein [Yeguia hominis]